MPSSTAKNDRPPCLRGHCSCQAPPPRISSEITEPGGSVRQSPASSLPEYFAPTADEISPSLRTSTTQDTEKPSPTRPLIRNPSEPRSEPSGGDNESLVRKEKKKLGWKGTTWVLIASQISLGVLSLPTAVAQVGLGSGLILMWFFQITCTYTGYVILQYMQNHLNCDSFADLMALYTGKTFGNRKYGRWSAEFMVTLYLLFLMAAHINVWRDTLYILTGNIYSCRTLYGFTGMMIILLINLAFPLEESMPLSVISCLSIVAALFTAMIGTGILNPGHGNWHWFITSSVPGITISHSSMGVSNIALSYVGHPMYPTIISGMKHRSDFWKSLLAFEAVRAIFLTLVGCLFYVWGGQTIVSPALGAASPLIVKTAYGIAIPTILMAGAIPAYIIAKGLNKQFWEFVGKPRRANMAGWSSSEEVRAQIPIRVILFFLWVLAFIIAMTIPVFEELLGFMGAFFATIFGLIVPSLFWWDMWKNSQFKDMSSPKQKWLMVVNAVVPVVGFAVMVLGLYGSGTQISFSAKNASPPFSCNIPQAVLKTILRMKEAER